MYHAFHDELRLKEYGMTTEAWEKAYLCSSEL